ncbi:hypothetical protein J6590_010225 [Homalodisca vitripennis]|nr:hypothetical protein J6590_010225 [Homalodisca vitripennis]
MSAIPYKDEQTGQLPPLQLGKCLESFTSNQEAVAVAVAPRIPDSTRSSHLGFERREFEFVYQNLSIDNCSLLFFLFGIDSLILLRGNQVLW